MVEVDGLGIQVTTSFSRFLHVFFSPGIFIDWDVDQLTMRGHIDIIDHVDKVRTLRIMAILED